MASKLKAKDPLTTEPSKPKMVIYGPSGVGKTWFSLSFPEVYYIDTEGGATRRHYMERLAKSGGKYLGPEDGSNDFETIIEQVKALGTEKHSFKTVVIDSITKPFITSITVELERLGNPSSTYGAEKKPAVNAMRRLVAAVQRLDMNVIFIAHEKADWGVDEKGNRAEIGKTPDVHDKLIYELDLALQVSKRGPDRSGIVKKTRLLGFPEGDKFVLDYEVFATRYGKDVITRETRQIVLATPEQMAEITRLNGILKTPQEDVDKWLAKANAETLSELNTDQAAKVISALQSKIK